MIKDARGIRQHEQSTCLYTRTYVHNCLLKVLIGTSWCLLILQPPGCPLVEVLQLLIAVAQFLCHMTQDAIHSLCFVVLLLTLLNVLWGHSPFGQVNVTWRMQNAMMHSLRQLVDRRYNFLIVQQAKCNQSPLGRVSMLSTAM